MKDISKMSEVELKARVYDLSVLISTYQQEIGLIGQELAKERKPDVGRPRKDT